MKKTINPETLTAVKRESNSLFDKEIVYLVINVIN